MTHDRINDILWLVILDGDVPTLEVSLLHCCTRGRNGYKN